MTALPAIPPRPATSARIQSVDALRGAIMMLMAIDHIRDYVARSAMLFSPTDLSRTTAAIFFTRWITHFCAPGGWPIIAFVWQLWVAKLFLLLLFSAEPKSLFQLRNVRRRGID